MIWVWVLLMAAVIAAGTIVTIAGWSKGLEWQRTLHAIREYGAHAPASAPHRRASDEDSPRPREATPLSAVH